MPNSQMVQGPADVLGSVASSRVGRGGGQANGFHWFQPFREQVLNGSRIIANFLAARGEPKRISDV